MINIKLALMDSDGTLTDGGYYINNESTSVFKRFYSRDFHGMQMLLETGIRVAVLTKSSTGNEKFQCDRISNGIECFAGVGNKLDFVRLTFVEPTSEGNTTHRDAYKWDEIAFIGDDVNDIDLLKAVGVRACPKDSALSVLSWMKTIPDGYIMNRNGGFGAVREFAELILWINQHCDTFDIKEPLMERINV